MKKFLFFAASFALALTSAPVSMAADKTENIGNSFGLTYETEGGNICITGYTGSDTIVMIPAEIQGKPVVSIAENAFMGAEDITVLVIPDSVTSIGDRAFSACPALSTVTLGSGVNEIGSMAFSACPTLQSFFVSDDNKTFSDINSSLFQGTELMIYAGGSEAEIPEGTISVRRGAFMGKTEITAVDFPASGLVSLGDYAFSGCTSLKKVVIPSNVTYTGTGCFAGCYGLEEVFLSRGCTSVKESTFLGCTSLYSITIPASVTDIGDQAFLGCAGISGIYIPTTVKNIGKDAIGKAYSVRGDSVETISDFIVHTEKGSAGAKYAETSDIAIQDFKIGDVNHNGIIDGSDATAALIAYTHLSDGAAADFDSYQRAAADWDGDDMLTASDATMILQEYTFLNSGLGS